MTITTEENQQPRFLFPPPARKQAPSWERYERCELRWYPPGSQTSQQVGFFNDGSSTLTVSSVQLPDTPFGVTGAPSGGDTIAPGHELFVNITFSPTAFGLYTSSLEVDSDGGDEVVTLTGNRLLHLS